MVKITGKWFSYSAYGTAMGVVSLSYLFGDAAARWFMGHVHGTGRRDRGRIGLARRFLASPRWCCWHCFSLNWLWLKESPLAIGHQEPQANPLNVYGAEGEDRQPRDARELARAASHQPAVSGCLLVVAGADTVARDVWHLVADLFCRRPWVRRAPRRPIKARCFRCWAARRCSWPVGWAIGWGRGAARR